MKFLGYQPVYLKIDNFEKIYFFGIADDSICLLHLVHCHPVVSLIKLAKSHVLRAKSLLSGFNQFSHRIFLEQLVVFAN